ncbi:phosphoenolpyruvate--protein phosphotransferase [Corynebacterium meitnerae]|uniref:Phosphoenolpyruvate-protein phosphotransferase n=1 Tax=Corynebacterium meitnerae TaxID=2913498 RepID=A0A9X3LUF8_9CORY|nr:phosphoenolpyruvate--protein phosphotransferase [Corynebacterium meitnerae]MCZ9294405.1 phosphoenolpyruvate--protein phosphotransferase [Corynebacterium meitnerae]
MANRHVFHGTGVSAGIACGPAVLVAPAVGVDLHEPACTDPEADGQRVRAAFDDVAASLLARAENAPEASPILEATATLAKDRALAKAVDKELAAGTGVTAAVHAAVEVYAQKLRDLGGYMAQRVTDLYDIRDRTIARLRDLPEPGVPPLRRPSVLVAHDLAPAEAALLDPVMVLGLVTEIGGPTSHTAILAAQLGVPMIVQVAGITELLIDATPITLDPTTDTVILAPTSDEVAELRDREERRAAALADSAGPGSTKDGHGVKLLANIGTAADVASAAAMDIEGTGLFRTEFLFLDRAEAPSVEEQAAAYTEVLRAFGSRRVVVRTLDAGADKPLAFADLGPEDNPALGRRGIRLTQVREDLLCVQLTALAAAHAAVPEADLWVMAPMVAEVGEVEWFVDKAKKAGLPRAGIMVETPAAAICAGELLGVAEFASIGTNDLAQYTMAADRLAGSELLTPWQPAVLALMRATCRGANGTPVGVCGEAGGDPLLALVLVGLGVTSLSMAPSKIPAVRAALRMHDLEACKEMARRALAARTADDARAAALAAAAPDLRSLL